MPLEIPQLKIAADVAARVREGRRVDIAGLWGSSRIAVAVQTAQALDRSLLVIAKGRIEA